MQKTITTIFIVLAVMGSAIAQQTVASDFYLMKNTKDADKVLSAINSELKLTETEYAKVKDVLSASAKSQEEQFALNPGAETTNAIKARQTAHIQNQLKNILGAQRYDLYLQKKAAIEKAKNEAANKN